MTDKEKIKAALEKATLNGKAIYEQLYNSGGFDTHAYHLVDTKHYNKALALLDTCQTCGGSKTIDSDCYGGTTKHVIPCPTCQSQEPVEKLPKFKDIIGLYADDEPESQAPDLEAHPLYEIAHALEGCCICYDVKMSEMPCNPPKCVPVIQSQKLWRIILQSPDHIPASGEKVEPVEHNAYAKDYPDCPHTTKGNTCWYGRKMNNGIYKCGREFQPAKDWVKCYSGRIFESQVKKVEPVSEFVLKVKALFMECNADINHSGEINHQNNIEIWRLLQEACDRLEAAYCSHKALGVLYEQVKAKLKAETERADDEHEQAVLLTGGVMDLDDEIQQLQANLKEQGEAISTCVGIIRASAQVNTKNLADMLEQTLKGQ